jgi:heptosyltransferase-2
MISFLADRLWGPFFQRIFYLIGKLFYRLSGKVSQSDRIELSQIRKVLIIRLDEIGDVVMMSPFLRELRANLPESHISLVVKPDTFNLVENCPYVNKVFTYEWKASKPFRPLIRFWRAMVLAKKHLWKQRFDIAIIPRWDADNYYATYLAFLSGSQNRIGYSEHVTDGKRRMNQGYDKFLTHPVPVYDDSIKHEVERNLYLLKRLGGKIAHDQLEVWISPDNEKYALDLLSQSETRESAFLVTIAPGASTENKRWPVERFLEIGNWLIENYRAFILTVGGEDEIELGAYLEHNLPGKSMNAAGKTNLQQTAALIKQSHLFIGNDSGPMHIAAACKIPVICINRFPKIGNKLHPQSPERFRPWGVKTIVLQPSKARFPCNGSCMAYEAHCILDVSADEVKESALNFLDKF